MIGRADIEGSKSDVAMNAWPPQASYPCGNFSDTSFFKLRNKEDRKADISALRPFTEGRSQGEPLLLRQHRLRRLLSTTRYSQVLVQRLPLPLLQRLELAQNEKNMEKPWETHLQTPLRNQD